MRLTAPRIEPLDLDALDDAQKEALAPLIGTGRVLNIFRTLAHAPKALDRFLQWGGYILSKRNSLSGRDRELAILRTGFNCKSGYEWTQHVPIGLDAGLTEVEVERIKGGPGAAGWEERDRAILCVVDDLTRDFFVSDAHWAALIFFTDKQKMDLVFTVGQYTQVSMFLNSFGVQLDKGQTLDPALKGFLNVAGRLAGKRAVVVGAGQLAGETVGNGRAIAIVFAREGAEVFCVDRELARARETVALIEGEGGVAYAFAADIARDAECRAVVEGAMARWGGIDILVNNVGIGGGGDGPAHLLTDEAFDRTMTINLRGMWQMIRATLPSMREARSGAIVNISSLASVAGGFQLAYEISKAAVNRLTTSVAQFNGGRGIRCNAILPGLMDTPMAVAGIAGATDRSVEEVRAERNKRVPLKGGMGSGWDTANAALFLASDEAKFITGVLLPVDGGASVRIG